MKAPVVSTYAALLKNIRKTLLFGQQKIDQARIETYWDTGRFIHEDFLLHQDRAGYGDSTLAKLSKDLEIGERLLERVLLFYRAFPSISSTWTKLSWSHFRALLVIEDDKTRFALADRAAKEGWASRVLEVEVRNLLWDKRVEALDGKPPSLLPLPVLGPFYTYPIIRPASVHEVMPGRALDLGFSAKKDMALFPDCRHPAGTLVTSSKDSKGKYSLGVARCALSELYTYKAFVEKVIDGDTRTVEFDIGFGDWYGETLRLKGIDCPELSTPEGQAARRFVEGLVADCDFIVIKSVKTRKEKWGRYLADVLLPVRGKKINCSEASRLTGPLHGELLYLNNLLLEKGHAVRVPSQL